MNDDQLYDRFATAGRPADAPEGASSDTAAGIAPMWATARRRRRNRRALGAASVAAVLLVAGVAVATVPDRSGDRDGDRRVASRTAAASSTSDSPEPSGDVLACAALSRRVYPGDSGPGDLPSTLAQVFADHDRRRLTITVDREFDAAAEAAFVADLGAQPGVTVLSAYSRAESLSSLEELGDYAGDQIADQIAVGSVWVRVELEDQDAVIAWVDAQPGAHYATRELVQTDLVTGWLSFAMSGQDASMIAAMRTSQDELRRSGLGWATDLAALLDVAAGAVGPFDVDADRLQVIVAEALDLAESCGS